MGYGLMVRAPAQPKPRIRSVYNTYTRLLACIIPKQLKRAPRIAAGRRGRIKIGWGERSERSMSEEQFLDVAVEAAKNAGEVPPPHRRGFFALRFLVLGPSVHRFLIS